MPSLRKVNLGTREKKEVFCRDPKKCPLNRNFLSGWQEKRWEMTVRTRLGDTKKSIVLSEKVWCVYPWASVDWICLCFCVSLMMLVLRSVLFAENGRMGMENRQCLCRILMNKMELEHDGMRFGRPSVALACRSLFRCSEVAFSSISKRCPDAPRSLHPAPCTPCVRVKRNFSYRPVGYRCTPQLAPCTLHPGVFGLVRNLS